MPPRQIREESWNSLHHSEASVDNHDDEYVDASMSDASDPDGESPNNKPPSFPTISDVHRALHPLQDTADRVGKQVEEFAENLDRLSIKRQATAQKDCSHVLPLVHSYKKIATRTVQHLNSLHAPERQQQLARNLRRSLRRSSRTSTPGSAAGDRNIIKGVGTTVEDLKFWQQEEQTWDLLELMLQVEYPARTTRASKKDQENSLKRPTKGAPVHRYSPEKEIWDSFLATDNQAWERHTVIEWLKRCADKSSQSIEQVVEELESGADRGHGLWAHSWLYSKEAIKGQKRLRSWPKALELDNPGLDTSLLNSEKTQALVTQLDPDAITRQGRSLEKQDYLFERAIWLACWEMLRRGRDWDYIREWCRERVEMWRATAMQSEPRSAPSHDPSAPSWQSRALWRKTCAFAAKEGGIDEYESAVYGALSGYLPAVLQVSRNWDDYLFAHYNSFLLHSYDRYVRTNCADKMPTGLMDQHGSFNFSTFGGQRLLSGNQIVEKMKLLDQTKEEARDPIKMLQGSLIAKTFDDFAYKHGVRLAQSANAGRRSKILTPMDSKVLEGEITAPLTLNDHNMLRLITHIIFIYQDLGVSFGEGDHYHAMESIIVAYIDYLSKAGKQQLLPLYAARLSFQRSASCLGRQLPFILDREERHTFLKLMAQEGIDVPGVLSTQLIMIIADTPPRNTSSHGYPELKIMEQGDGDLPKPRPIEANFIGNEITDDQQDLVHGFEWYLLLDGHWRETMMVGAVIYKHLLRSRAFAAARLLSQTVTFSKISLSKTKTILGGSLDISKSQESDDEEDTDSSSQHRISRRAQKRLHRRQDSSHENIITERNMMLSQGKTFRDLECLFIVLDAIEEWERFADEGKKYLSQLHGCKPRHDSRAIKEGMHEAYNRVEVAMEPLLHDWMLHAKNETEEAEFKRIRVACLPEIILAYITVLDFSSRFLSRDLLIKGMDLAALIAAEDSDLASCFILADRMPELVDSLASLSKLIIQADDAKSGRGKKKRNGGTLGLWTVRTPSP